MHRAFFVSVAIALATGVSSQKPSGLDAPILPFQVPTGVTGCDLQDVVADFAKATGTLVGFEWTSSCASSGTADPSLSGLVLSGLTARAAVDRLVALDATYRWEDQDGVAVIRPVMAWTDSNDVLNLARTSFSVTNADLGATLGASMNVTVPANRSGNPTLTRRLSFSLPEATVVETLNTVIRTHGESGWFAGLEFARSGNVLDPLRFAVRIETFDGSVVAVATPLAHFRTHHAR
jgi:hypothetical protein